MWDGVFWIRALRFRIWIRANIFLFPRKIIFLTVALFLWIKLPVCGTTGYVNYFVIVQSYFPKGLNNDPGRMKLFPQWFVTIRTNRNESFDNNV